MRNILFVAICFMTACNSSYELQEGNWSGHLTPMNHPEMSIPVNYSVTYTKSGLNISIIGSDGVPVKTENPRIARDSLLFAFNEPEEQVKLDCALVRNNEMDFTGRCTDSSGKWAEFTMVAP